jgi:hypothetical protein
MVQKALGVDGKFFQALAVHVGSDKSKSLAMLSAQVSDSIVSTPVALLSPP